MKLLEYKNQYGYVFLEDFIRLAGFKLTISPETQVTFETEYFDAVPVEKRANKKMQGRIDGLIYQKENFAIIIENKINGATNQDVQLERYIKSVVGNGNRECLAKNDNVYVVFLTKDSVGDPDNKSITYMRNNGILNQSESGSQADSIAGPRYYACSYRYDILPWLENNVQPLVFYKESILSAGLVQYIDFLKGILGEREVKNAIWDNCKKWFDNNQTIQTALNGNLQEQNSFLYCFYQYLKDKNNNLNSNKSEEETKRTASCINLLQSLVCEKAEEPMAEFMKATKEFFTSGDINNPPLIEEKDYIVNHHFTFYYINIRDKNWPVGVKIGWYPAHFFYEQPTASLFYEDPSKVGTEEENDGNGFKYNITGKAWRREYPSTDHPCINVESFEGEKLKKLYEDSGIRVIIESFNQSIKLKNKAY